MDSVQIISGIVHHGHHRGKRFGFPTINFPLTENFDEGIYIAHITIHDKKYNALTFIGAAKTFGETTINAETYVFDFNEDIYGEQISVSLLKKIRDNQKFHSEQELIEQMEDDKKQAIEFFKKL